MIYKLLIKLGYHVGCREGKRFQKLNRFDFILLVGYIAISMFNFFTSKPSYLVWGLNIIIITRIITRNIIEIKNIKTPLVGNRQENGQENVPENEQSHINKVTTILFLPLKITVEVTFVVIMFLLLILNIITGNIPGAGIISGGFKLLFDGTGIIVLTFSFLEDLLKIIEQLYDAKIEPFLVENENT